MRRAVLALLAILSGCVEQGAGPPDKRKIDPTYIQSHLLAKPPVADANFEAFNVPVGTVAIYLGNTVDKPRVPPGQPVTITHYWKVLKSPGPAWNVFTLVRGPAGTADFMNLLATDMQLGHGPATWEPGEIIEDIQTFTVRPDWRSDKATVLVGLIEQGKHGTLDRMPVDGRETPGHGAKTRDSAIIARELEIDLSRAPAPKGTAYIPRAQGAITVDGIANDPGWAGAVQSELATAEGGSDPIGKATARMVWDDEFLYVTVAITDTDIVSPYKQQDDPLWKGDCVELFIDADGNRRGYVELQANPLGITFDSWFAETRGAKPGDEAWDSHMVAAAKLRGSTDGGDSGDSGWDIELAIPWAAVKGRDDQMKVRLPPQIGDRWRLNVVRVDRKTNGKPNDVAASSWNRITMADFHALDRMLVAVFADASGSIVPQAASAIPPAEPPTIDVRLSPQLDPQTPALVVDVAAAGQRVANRSVTDAELATILAATIARAPATELVLRVEPGVAYLRTQSVLDRAKAAGFARVAFAVTAPPANVGSGSGSGSAGSAAMIGTIGSGGGAPPALPFGLTLDVVKPIDIEVAAAGARTGGKLLADEQVGMAMRAVLARAPNARVVLRTEPGALHARVVTVIEQVERAGITRIAVAVAAPVASVTPLPVPAQAIEATKSSLVIEVPATGDVVVGGKLVVDAQLDNLFAAAYARDKLTQVTVKPDKATPPARLLGLVERAKRAGLTKLVVESAKP
ncbi:MAG: sugar-binding protein [Kofleriaceae bacterium]